MAIGDMLAQQQAPLQPPRYEDAQMPASPVAEAQGRGGGGGIRDIAKRPEVMLFLMQAGLSAMSGRGIGEAIGDAANSVGTYAQGQEQKRLDREKEERRRFESDREFALRQQAAQRAAAGRGGGGRGRAAAATPSGLSGMSASDWAKILFDEDTKAWEDASEFGDAGPRPSRLSYEIRGMTLAQATQNGMPVQLYDEFRRAGARGEADALAEAFASSAEEGQAFLESFMNYVDPTPPAAMDVPPEALPTPGGAPVLGRWPGTPGAMPVNVGGGNILPDDLTDEGMMNLQRLLQGQGM